MSTPVWTWLPGATEPVLAAELAVGQGSSVWRYLAAYREAAQARALDPMRLRLKPGAMRFAGEPGLPGVVVDAMPAGYGYDRLQARFGRELTPLECLEHGPGDAVGAIEVCQRIEAKLAWRPHRLEALVEQLGLLDHDLPSSRAIRRLDADDGTSAGGDRPKLTVETEGRLWLAKLQDRGDAPHLPAREHAVMALAGEVGIEVPSLRLYRHGPHEVFLIERFDRAGDPLRPQRHLFASAHSVLGLDRPTLPGDPARSYLVFADRLRQWIRDEALLAQDLTQLWQRMAYNALVGNKDDHTRNHGLLHDGTGWRLSPAYDITPLPTFVRSLAMGVRPDGSQDANPASLLSVAPHFGLALADAAAWLAGAAIHVAQHWRARLRDSGVPEARLPTFEPAFVIAEEVAAAPARLDAIVQGIEQARAPRRGRQPRRP